MLEGHLAREREALQDATNKTAAVAEQLLQERTARMAAEQQVCCSVDCIPALMLAKHLCQLVQYCSFLQRPVLVGHVGM